MKTTATGQTDQQQVKTVKSLRGITDEEITGKPYPKEETYLINIEAEPIQCYLSTAFLSIQGTGGWPL